MNKSMAFVMMMALVASTGLVFAQPFDGAGQVPQIDPNKVVTVRGEVVRYVAAYGAQQPELVVRDSAKKTYTIIMGPYWYLLNQGFDAKPGDTVEVVAYACFRRNDLLAAKEATNETKGFSVVFRDSAGWPLWARGGGTGFAAGMGMMAHGRGRGNGPGGGQRLCGGLGPDTSRVSTLSGTVKDFRGSYGQGAPTLVLETPAGDREIFLSPYRSLAQLGIQLKPGTALDVKAAPVSTRGVEYWFAISIREKESGQEFDLRDPDTGLPFFGWGGWGGRCWRR